MFTKLSSEVKLEENVVEEINETPKSDDEEKETCVEE